MEGNSGHSTPLEWPSFPLVIRDMEKVQRKRRLAEELSE